MPKTTAQNRATLAKLNDGFTGSPSGERRAGPAPTALQPQAKPNATLTQVMLRSIMGPKGGLRPEDTAPAQPQAKPLTLDYPHIQSQPEYAVEAEKINRFTKELEDANSRLAELYQKLANHGPLDTDAARKNSIAKAESLLAGTVDIDHHKELQDEYSKTNKLIHVLREALDAQTNVIRRITWDLSQAAGRRYANEHKERVRRIIAAVVELNAANQAEVDLRKDLERLGYTEGAVPAMRLNVVEDHTDTNGNLTHYWFKEAEKYVKSDAELAAGVRKSRSAKLLNSD